MRRGPHADIFNKRGIKGKRLLKVKKKCSETTGLCPPCRLSGFLYKLLKINNSEQEFITFVVYSHHFNTGSG